MANSEIKVGMLIDLATKGTGDLNSLLKQLKEAGVNTDKFDQELTALNTTMGKLGQQQGLIDNFKSLKKESADTADSLDKAQQKVIQLAQAGKKSSSEFKRAVAEVKRLKDAQSGLSEQTQKTRKSLSDVGISTKKLASEQQRLTSEARKTTTAITLLNTKAEKLAKRKFGKGFKQGLEDTKKSAIGLKATLSGLAIAMTAAFATSKVAGFFKSAISGAAGLEEQLDKVRAISGATDTEMSKIAETSKELGATTRYTATQSAEGFEMLARAGLNATESIQALPSVLSLAQASGLGLAESANFITKTIAGMNLEMSDSARVADVLAKASASANTDVEGLGQALSYAAPSANALGVSLEDTVAIISKFADAGIDASRAGTALNSIFSQFSNPASAFRNELSAIGINTDNVVEALRQLESSGSAGSKAILAVGQEAGPALKALLAQGTGALDELSEKLQNAGGSAQKMAQTMDGNLFGSLRGLGSAWDSLKNTLGEPVLKPITEQVTRLTVIIRDFVSGGEVEKLGDYFAKTFGDMSKAVVDFVENFSLGDTSNQVSDFANNTIAKFEKVGAGFTFVTSTISVGFNGFKVAILSVGAVVADVVALIIQGFGEIAGIIPGMGDVEKNLKDVAGGLREVAKGYVDASEESAKKVVKGLNEIGDAAKVMTSTTKSHTQVIKDNTEAVKQNAFEQANSAKTYADKSQLIKDEIARLEEHQARIEKLGKTESEVYKRNSVSIKEYQNELKKLNDNLSLSLGKRAGLTEEISKLEEKQKDLIALQQQESEEYKKNSEAIKQKTNEVSKLNTFINNATVQIENKTQADKNSRAETEKSIITSQKQSDAFKAIGIDLDQLATGMTKTEQTVVNSLAPALDGVRNKFKGMGDETERTSNAINTVLVQALGQIQTPAGLEAFETKLGEINLTGAEQANMLEMMKSKANELNKAYQELGASIASATSQEELNTQMSNLSKAQAEGRISNEQYSDSIKDLVAKRNELFLAERNSEQAIKKTSETSKEAATSTAAVANEVAKTSKEFDRAADSTESMTTSFSMLNGEAAKSPELIEKVKRGMQGVAESGSVGVNSFANSFNNLNDSVKFSSQMFNEEAEQVDLLIGRLNAGSASMSDLAQASSYAVTGVGHLDDARLDNLNASIAQVKASMESLRDASDNALASIEQTLLAEKGDEKGALQLRENAEIEKLNDEMTQAQLLNDKKLIASIQERIDKTKELYSIRENKIEERKAKKQSDTGSTSQKRESAGSSGLAPVYINLNDSEPVKVEMSHEAADQLATQMKGLVKKIKSDVSKQVVEESGIAFTNKLNEIESIRKVTTGG